MIWSIDGSGQFDPLPLDSYPFLLHSQSGVEKRESRQDLQLGFGSIIERRIKLLHPDIEQFSSGCLLGFQRVRVFERIRVENVLKEILDGLSLSGLCPGQLRFPQREAKPNAQSHDDRSHGGQRVAVAPHELS